MRCRHHRRTPPRAPRCSTPEYVTIETAVVRPQPLSRVRAKDSLQKRKLLGVPHGTRRVHRASTRFVRRCLRDRLALAVKPDARAAALSAFQGQCGQLGGQRRTGPRPLRAQRSRSRSSSASPRCARRLRGCRRATPDRSRCGAGWHRRPCPHRRRAWRAAARQHSRKRARQHRCSPRRRSRPQARNQPRRTLNRTPTSRVRRGR